MRVARGAVIRGRFRCGGVCFCFASASGAAEWTVLPRLSLSETYTDNVRLGGGFGGVGGFGAGRNAGGDFVTQINPGGVIRGQGAALTST